MKTKRFFPTSRTKFLKRSAETLFRKHQQRVPKDFVAPSLQSLFGDIAMFAGEAGKIHLSFAKDGLVVRGGPSGTSEVHCIEMPPGI
jgi:hypothetical protein